MSADVRNRLFTWLLSGSLTLSGWITYTTHATKVSVAELKADMRFYDRDLLDVRARLQTNEIELAKLRSHLSAKGL